MSPHSPIAPESRPRVAPPSQPPESHGRTDGRTDEDPHYVTTHAAVPNVRGGVEGFPDLDLIRDVARAASAALVQDELDSNYRVRKPRDPGSTYVKPALRYLLAAADLGLIEVKPRA